MQLQSCGWPTLELFYHKVALGMLERGNKNCNKNCDFFLLIIYAREVLKLQVELLEFSSELNSNTDPLLIL